MTNYNRIFQEEAIDAGGGGREEMNSKVGQKKSILGALLSSTKWKHFTLTKLSGFRQPCNLPSVEDTVSLRSMKSRSAQWQAPLRDEVGPS